MTTFFLQLHPADDQEIAEAEAMAVHSHPPVLSVNAWGCHVSGF